ncbi:hypothetical protein HDV02_006508 [Globomyces sp. JEL0801]|nr:hypothetical protein HDV02_006508 [Globomyces sp. JEL0801]
MKSTAAPVQDMAPVGGFQQTVKYKRNLPSRGPSGALLLAASVAMIELKREKIWARIQLVPLLMAETDRDTVRRLDSLAAKESQIMKDHPNWAPMDLKAPVPGLDKLGKRSDTAAEPVYHTERYVSPTMVFLPNDNFMSAQWWRGTKVFTSCVHSEKELLQELKNLQAQDMSNAGASLSALFGLLNLHRVMGKRDVVGKINIPGLKTTGADGFLEPFRWEQRLYTIALVHDHSKIMSQVNVMSDVMGGNHTYLISGQFWRINSLRQLLQCIDNCHGLGQPRRHPNVHPYQPICHIEGVSVTIEPHPENETIKTAERLFIYANHTVSRHFPIPETFWPDAFRKENGSLVRFPPRTAHPVIYYSTKDSYYNLLPGFPVDRFSMEQSSMAQELIKRPKGPLRTAMESINLGHVWNSIKLPDITFDITDQSERLAQLASTAYSNIVSSTNVKPTTTNKTKTLTIAENVYDISAENLLVQLNLMREKISGHQNVYNPNMMSKKTQEELDELHTGPIAEMGNYQEAMTRQQILRNPFDGEEDLKEREKSLFGNPYRKTQKATSKKAADEISLAETMNEAEEEGTHQFTNESAALSKTVFKKRRIESSNSRGKIPALCKSSGLVIPNFKDLKWDQLDSFDYSSMCNTLEKEVESMVAEIEETVDTTMDGIEQDVYVDLNAPVLMNESEYGGDSETLHPIPEEDYSMIEGINTPFDWLKTKKDIYTEMTQWPTKPNDDYLFFLKSILQSIKHDSQLEKEVSLWIIDLARSFNRNDIVDHVQSILQQSQSL